MFTVLTDFEKKEDGQETYGNERIVKHKAGKEEAPMQTILPAWGLCFSAIPSL
jgi:hypothetical protein